MRILSDMLESVVLDSIVALSCKNWSKDQTVHAQWGIDNLTALCEAHKACRDTCHIPACLESASALFPEEPLTSPYTDPGNPSITLVGTEAGYQIVASRDMTAGPLAILMHVAMICSADFVSSLDDVIIEDGTAKYARLFAKNSGAEYVSVCPPFNVQKLPDTTDEKVPVDVPLPLPVADALPKNTLLIVQGRTHVQVDGSNLSAAQIMTGFVLHPTAPLDTSRTGNPCLHQTTLPGDVPCEDGSGD